MHLPERCHRQDEIARRTAGTQCAEDREARDLGFHLVGPQIQAGPDENVPEALDRRHGLPVTPEELAEGLALPRRQSRQSRQEQSDPQAVAEDEVPVTEERTEAVADLRGPAALVDHGQLERPTSDVVRAADPLEEAEILGEAAERDVLAVVRGRIGIALALGQRLHLAAEGGASL